ASTILAGPAGALGFTGELAADLFAPLNAYERGAYRIFEKAGPLLPDDSSVVVTEARALRACSP
ncbi:MAG: hypothetical protein JXA30_13080, partial [Deltaproteobacteria bacterium]|nr:hypothetical protein [Deltaproteobacteria bacterium]